MLHVLGQGRVQGLDNALTDKSEHAGARTCAQPQCRVTRTSDPIGSKTFLAGSMCVQTVFKQLNLVLAHIRVEVNAIPTRLHISNGARKASQYVAIMGKESEADDSGLVPISALLESTYELQRTFDCCVVACSATAGGSTELFHCPRFAVHPGFCSCTLPPMLFCLQASSCCKPKVTQPSQLSADGSLLPSLQCRVGAQPRSSWPPHGMEPWESWRDFSFLRSRSSAKDRRKAVPAIYSGHN